MRTLKVAFNSNSTGYDNIPIKLIKIIYPLISSAILHLINTIFNTSTFPKAWKLGRVVSISKDNYTCCDNLRRITILPSISKILENIMKAQSPKSTLK